MTTQVNLYEAKTHLSDLVERASRGEDIVIAKSGKPRVRLVAVPVDAQERTPGRWRDQTVLGPGWDEDLTDEFEDL